MSKLALVARLYEYNAWANEHLCSVASGLSEDELRTEDGSYSLLGSFGHIAAAQVNWLERWRTGRNSVPTAERQRYVSLAAVRAAVDGSHNELREYIGGLDDERLDGDLTFRDSSGSGNTVALWRLMLHVANHGSYHRGEIAMMLTQLGRSPGDLDFVFWDAGKL
jgi:uncharacterized damage-inducible protein DinB